MRLADSSGWARTVDRSSLPHHRCVLSRISPTGGRRAVPPGIGGTGRWSVADSLSLSREPLDAGLRPPPAVQRQSPGGDQRADRLDIPYLHVHPGAQTGAGEGTGVEDAAAALERLDVPGDVSVMIGSDAGAGTKLGGEFEHFVTVRDAGASEHEVCLDTAHPFAAGYTLASDTAVETTVAEFERLSLRLHLGHVRHGHPIERSYLLDGDEPGPALVVNLVGRATPR